MKRKLSQVMVLGLSFREVCEMVGSRALADELKRSGAIRPLPHGVYSAAQVIKAFAELEEGKCR